MKWGLYLVIVVCVLVMVWIRFMPPEPPAPTQQSVTPTLSDETGTGKLVFAKPVTLKEAVAKLRKEAAKKNLYWVVFCTESTDERRAFMASAEIPGHAWNHYIEDGGLPGYMAHGHTQIEAITALIEVLSIGPNMIPDPKPKDAHKHQCPPPIEGGPQ